MRRVLNISVAATLLCIVCGFACGPLNAADVVHLKKGEKTIECLVISENCRVCRGEGHISCPTCGGKGKITQETVCPRCEGRGRVVCPACDGLCYFGDEITVRVHGGIILRIPLSEIERIERGGGSEEDFMTPEQAYKKLVREMDQNDANAHLKLGKWALGKGLYEEAAIHLLRARMLDTSLSDEVAPLLEQIRQKREALIEAKFRESLQAIVQARYPEALKALEDLVAAYPDSALLRTRSLQERIVREILGVEATRWGITADELISSLRRREALLCRNCHGSGLVVCSLCGGTGDAVCKRCSGSGRVVCPDCNGTTRAVCPTCFGNGRVERPLGFGTEITLVCPTCDGKGSVLCRRCRGKGKLRCPDCEGRGRVKGGCPLCNGKTKIQCPVCRGRGLQPPSVFRWGPYNVFPALTEGEKAKPGAVLAFQARYHGALVTLVPEQAAYGGRLAAYLEQELGENRGYLLLCIDNRRGNEVIRLGEKGHFLRLVSPGAVQVEMLAPLGVRSKLEQAGTNASLLEVVAPGDVMPYAVRNVLCVFPEKVTSGLGYRVFFGEQDVMEMDVVAASAAEVRVDEGPAVPKEATGIEGR